MTKIPCFLGIIHYNHRMVKLLLVLAAVEGLPIIAVLDWTYASKSRGLAGVFLIAA